MTDRNERREILAMLMEAARLMQVQIFRLAQLDEELERTARREKTRRYRKGKKLK